MSQVLIRSQFSANSKQLKGFEMARDLVILECTECKRRNYTTDKNKRTTPDKIEIKKFDPVVRKHVIYKEAKIK